MSDRKILRFESTGFVEHADLSGIAEHECTDTAVGRHGRADVGHF